ncbi:uncharacterized protein BDV14DRAFT_198800 [Aspergillus stella-maris]|uniref:uncharacterized protein n=1 Tax=Aspergillus stella-maris TaxID=1810926 RepID=UPI003CCD84BF
MDPSAAPPEYQAVAWFDHKLALLAAAGWTLNYITMAYQSWKDKTYGMAIIPLCCNLAWEIVYVSNQSRSGYSAVVAATYLVTNLAVMYAAIKHAPTEWAHAPLVQRNIHWLFLAGILVCTAGHRAVAAQLGPGLGYYYGGMFCQLILELGAICQLLVRGSSRGVSYTMWLVLPSTLCLSFSPEYPDRYMQGLALFRHRMQNAGGLA